MVFTERLLDHVEAFFESLRIDPSRYLEYVEPIVAEEKYDFDEEDDHESQYAQIKLQTRRKMTKW